MPRWRALNSTYVRLTIQQWEELALWRNSWFTFFPVASSPTNLKAKGRGASFT